VLVGKCTSLLVDSPRRRAADRATGLVADACGARRKKSRVSRRREKKRHAFRGVCAPLCVCRSQLRARHVYGHCKYLKRAVKCYWEGCFLSTLHQRVFQYPFPETSADTSACEKPLGLLSVIVYCKKQRQRVPKLLVNHGRPPSRLVQHGGICAQAQLPSQPHVPKR